MAPASVNSSSGSAPGRRRVFFVPMDMGEGSARCLVWWHEQWASFGLNCVLCWADRGEIDLAHHFFPGNFLWATRASGFRRLPSMEFPIFGSPRRRPSDFKRPDHILRNTRFTKAPPQQQPRWDDTWHTCMPSVECGSMAMAMAMVMATPARSGLSKRQPPSSKLSNPSTCCCCRVDSRGHSGEWQTHAAASTGRSCLVSSPRPDRRLPEPQLVVMPCNNRPPCGEPSIVVWHGCGTTLPRRPPFPALLEAQSALQHGPRDPSSPLPHARHRARQAARRSVPSPGPSGLASAGDHGPLKAPWQSQLKSRTGRQGGERGDRATGRQQSKRPLIILCRRSLRTSPDFSLCFLGILRSFPKKQRSRSHPPSPAPQVPQTHGPHRHRPSWISLHRWRWRRDEIDLAPCASGPRATLRSVIQRCRHRSDGLRPPQHASC